MEYNIIADRLRIARKKRKLTQTELAKFINVSQNAINGWETARREPSYKDLIKIANILNITIAYLFGQDDKTQKLLEILKPKIIKDLSDNKEKNINKDISKWSYNKLIQQKEKIQKQYFTSNDKEIHKEIIKLNIEINEILFYSAYEELIKIEPEENKD